MMKALLWTLVILCSSAAYAGQMTIPNTFTSGTKAKAAEVNANFIALEQDVNDNDTKIIQNTSDIYSNSSGVGINAAGVLGNASNISNNTANITTNANNISSNSTAITSLQQPIPTTYHVVDSYGTVLGDLIGADMISMTFITVQGYTSSISQSVSNLILVGDSQLPSYYSGAVSDYYSSVDCTGAPFPSVSQYFGPGKVFMRNTFVPFTQVYVAITEPLTIYNYASVAQVFYSLDSITGLPVITTNCQRIVTITDPYTGLPIYGTSSITGYHFLANDPVVTGVPNTIAFPVSIQKK